jgi:hypothetical protein
VRIGLPKVEHAYLFLVHQETVRLDDVMLCLFQQLAQEYRHLVRVATSLEQEVSVVIKDDGIVQVGQGSVIRVFRKGIRNETLDESRDGEVGTSDQRELTLSSLHALGTQKR